MPLKDLLLAAILQWNPPWYAPDQNPESVAQYQTRLSVIAEAVALEVEQLPKPVLGKRELAAATLTIWYGESKFAYEIHALGESRWDQDVGKARCMGQVHASGLVPRSEWEHLVGADLEATRNCARATLRVISAMARYCGVRAANRAGLERVFGAYGSGKGCSVTDQARERAKRWYTLMQSLYAARSPAIATARRD